MLRTIKKKQTIKYSRNTIEHFFVFDKTMFSNPIEIISQGIEKNTFVHEEFKIIPRIFNHLTNNNRL